MYKSLVLSGNSTNALKTLGAIQFLFENNILNHVEKYYATSSGTVISVLLIIGYKPLEIISLICYKKMYKSVGLLNFFNIFNDKTLLSFEPLAKFLDFLIMSKIGYIPTIIDLKNKYNVEFTLTTYNLTDEKKEYVNYKNYPNLSVLDGIRMSCSFPFVFEAFRYNDKEYIDGGFVDNFPVGCTDPEDLCLGILTKNPTRNESTGYTFGFLMKLLLVFVQTSTLDKINDASHCDFIILETSTNFFNFTSTNKEIIEMFDKGYELCKSFLSQTYIRNIGKLNDEEIE